MPQMLLCSTVGQSYAVAFNMTVSNSTAKDGWVTATAATALDIDQGVSGQGITDGGTNTNGNLTARIQQLQQSLIMSYV